MHKLITAALSSLVLASAAYAQTTHPVVTPGSTPGAPGAPVGQVSAASSAATAQTPTAAQCDAKAVDKNGKPLTGDAKGAFIKACIAASK
jgi:hypothetical protein